MSKQIEELLQKRITKLESVVADLTTEKNTALDLLHDYKIQNEFLRSMFSEFISVYKRQAE